MIFELTDATRKRIAAHGEAGQNWLNSLDAHVDELLTSWQLTSIESLAGGSESLVLRTKRQDGSLAILKLGLPGSSNLHQEAKLLAIAGGRGYARLLESDPHRNAMLIEALGKPVAQLNLPVHEQIDAILSTLQNAWLPIAHQHADKVLVHGDAHEQNTLADPQRSHHYRFIDPDGLFAEPAYDVGLQLRSWDEDLLRDDPRKAGIERCRYLARNTGLDEQAIWQWGFIERTSTGLHLLELGLTELGETMLGIAEAWTEA
jgi:streptomycin 6-kinase